MTSRVTGESRASVRPGLSWLVGAGLLLLVATAAVVTPADADLWGHLAFGRDIVTSGAVVQTDQYSFTSDRPWVNHEWLSEVAFYDVYHLAGSPGLVVLKLIIIVALLGVLWRYLQRFTRSTPVKTALVLLVFVGTLWRTHNVRPQLFSVLLFATLLIVMVGADSGRRRGLLIVPPVMALWVNLHGGWIVGLGVFGWWVIIRTLDWRASSRARLFVALLGLAVLASTLINPYGARLWTFLAETVRPERADIEDWGSILTSPFALGIPWALTLAAAVMAIWRSGWPRRLDYVALIVGLALASFRVSRLDAFFALAVVILLAPQLANAWTWVPRAEAARPMPQARQGYGVLVLTLVALLGMIVPAAGVLSPYATCLSIGGAWPPEAEAGQFIALNHLKGRMLTWYDWGEYVIWHFGPSLQVSMDGRRETVYSDGTIQAHRRFYAADQTARAFLQQLNPDYIWVPKRLPIARQLADAKWIPVFSGSVSLVLARPGAGPFQQVSPLGSAARCFPGP